MTAIDIALEPDATMIQHAMAANARLLKSFPKGFALDETHHPHVTMLQQFVRTDDLDKVFAAANAVLAKEKPTAWTLKAFKYYYIPSPPIGLAGIVVEPTEDLHRLQDELIKAVEPYTVKTGTPAAFFSEDGGRDIQKFLIEYVANFVTDRGGQAIQSACDDRRRNGNIFEQDVGGAIPVVHVLGGWRVGLSAWQLWHSSEGTQGVDADALTGRQTASLPPSPQFRALQNIASSLRPLIFRRTAMKSDDLSPGIDRRTLVSNLVLLPALSTTLLSSPVQAQTTPNAPLASWNEGPAKQAILDFVRATTDQGSSKFVPARGSHRHFRSRRHALGRASNLYAGDLLPGSRFDVGGAEARTQKDRTVQDRAVRRPGSDGQAVDARPGDNSRRDSDRHAG